MPLSLEELRPACAADPLEACVIGGYPRIHEQRLDATIRLDDYITTYLEREVRSVLNVGNLNTFQTFLGLCADRAEQLLNSPALGADAGVNSKTARAWLSVLEAGFLVFQLRLHFRNVGERLTKRSKLDLHDTGLRCRLLGIQRAEQLREHPLRGSIFESPIVSKSHNSRLHGGPKPQQCF